MTRQPTTLRGGLLTPLLTAAILLLPSAAQAGIEFVEVQTTLVPLGGAGANPAARLAVSEGGQVVLFTQAQDGAHVIPVDLGSGGTPIVYSYEGGTVTPVSATFGPDGDFLLRGAAGDPMSPLGVTARIALGEGGSVVWETPDSAFSDDDAYVGQYVQPTGPIVWSGLQQRVLIFTEASFEVAPVSQGSALFEFNGEARVPSVLFGTEYVGASLGNALRTPDGEFLVYYLSQNDVGARFFVYDGRESISTFDVEGGDWANRIVYQVQYDPNGNLILLWNDVASSGDAGHLTKLDPEGGLLWETELAGAITVADPETGGDVTATMGRPVFMVSAADEVVLLRQAGQTFVFDARDSVDGTPLGFFDFFQITDNSVVDLAFLNGSTREYVLSTVNPDDSDNNHLLQVRLQINDDPVEIMDPDGEPANNAGGTNNGPFGTNGGDGGGDDEDRERPDVGCGCSAVDAGAAGGLWVVVLIGWFGLRRRR